MELKKIFSYSRVRIGQLFIVGLCALIIVTDTVEKGIAGGILFLIGTMLAGVAAVGRMWCSLYISGYKKDVLITAGPYSMSRNPLYFFSLLGTAGVGLATGTVTVPAIAVSAFMLYYPVVIRREEERLTRIHGKTFEDYCKKVPRFIPAISLLKEPEEYTVKPKFLRGRFTDSLWFMWLIGVIALIESLHRHGILPVYWKLY